MKTQATHMSALDAARAFFFSAPPLSVFFAGIPFAHAAQGKLLNPLKYTNIADVIVEILKVISYLGFFIAIFFIVYSGFLFVTAQGNEEKLKEARTNFYWTVIGVAILLGAWAIALIVRATVQQIAPGVI